MEHRESVTVKPLSSPGVVLPKHHSMQGLWGGAWLALGVVDGPGDQTMANLHSFVCELSLPAGSLICGSPELRLAFRERPDKFHLVASLCEKSAAGEKQLSCGFAFVNNTRIMSVKMSAFCYRHIGRTLILALKTQYFPLIPPLSMCKPVEVDHLTVVIPTVSLWSPGSALLATKPDEMPNCDHTVVTNSTVSRKVTIDLGGSGTDYVRVTRHFSSGHALLPKDNIEYEEYGTDSAAVDFDMKEPVTYTAVRSSRVKHNEHDTETRVEASVVAGDNTFDANISLAACYGRIPIFKKSWQQTFSRNS